MDPSYIADDDEDIDMSLLELMQSMLELDAIISDEDDMDISLLEVLTPHASEEDMDISELMPEDDDAS